MLHPDSLSLSSVLKNFADSAAIQFHDFSKRCVGIMKNKIDNQQKKWAENRAKLLQRYRNRNMKHNPLHRQSFLPSTHKSGIAPSQQQQETEESRLARINRIKQAIQSKNNQNIQPEQFQNMPLDNSVILQHFSNELRPQILAKYPSAPAQKVNKVILQKWTTIQAAKKEAYIKKIMKKIQQEKQAEESKNEKIPVEDQVKRQQPHELPSKPDKTQNRFENYLDKIKQKDREQDIMTDQMDTPTGKAQQKHQHIETILHKQSPQNYSEQTYNQDYFNPVGSDPNNRTDKVQVESNLST